MYEVTFILIFSLTNIYQIIRKMAFLPTFNRFSWLEMPAAQYLGIFIEQNNLSIQFMEHDILVNWLQDYWNNLALLISSINCIISSLQNMHRNNHQRCSASYLLHLRTNLHKPHQAIMVLLRLLSQLGSVKRGPLCRTKEHPICLPHKHPQTAGHASNRWRANLGTSIPPHRLCHCQSPLLHLRLHHRSRDSSTGSQTCGARVAGTPSPSSEGAPWRHRRGARSWNQRRRRRRRRRMCTWRGRPRARRRRRGGPGRRVRPQRRFPRWSGGIWTPGYRRHRRGGRGGLRRGRGRGHRPGRPFASASPASCTSPPTAAAATTPSERASLASGSLARDAIQQSGGGNSKVGNRDERSR